MANLAEGLTWSARRHPGDENLYDFGIVYEGAFIPLITTKSGRVDKLIARAKAEAEPAPAEAA
jgi:hypothetical protein